MHRHQSIRYFQCGFHPTLWNLQRDGHDDLSQDKCCGHLLRYNLDKKEVFAKGGTPHNGTHWMLTAPYSWELDLMVEINTIHHLIKIVQFVG